MKRKNDVRKCFMSSRGAISSDYDVADVKWKQRNRNVCGSHFIFIYQIAYMETLHNFVSLPLLTFCECRDLTSSSSSFCSA